MKRSAKHPLATGPQLSDFRLQTSDFRLSAAVLLMAFVFAVAPAFALTEANPYSAIVGRNAFALKPPTPVSNTPTAPVALPPTIELQGITTILGRPQVLLKIKLPARPPEPAKDQSVVLDVGQREGDVEVLEINVTAGSVKLRNQGAELPLNMQDNAAKPVASLITPTLAGVPLGNPGIPAPLSPPPTGARGSSVTTMGGAGSVPMPSRSLRSPIGVTSGSVNPQAQRPRDLSAEEGAALLEINRKANEGKGLPFPPPRVNLNQ